LRSLGYAPQRDFVTAVAAGGETLFQTPGWENYFVRLKVDRRTEKVEFRVVCEGDATAVTAADRARDRTIEEAWCRTSTELEGKLQEAQIDLAMSRRVARDDRRKEAARRGSASAQEQRLRRP
jgi:hypothetical protein